jgi:anti-sigma factor RsiW
MKNDCTKWKDQLLEGALTGTVAGDLQQHLLTCASCTEEFSSLRSRHERLDALLPLVAQGAEPSPEFRARVLAAAEAAGKARRTPSWLAWGLATVAAGIVAALITSFALRSRTLQRVPMAELAAAQKLAEWRAPSDTLLDTPGRELLRSTPKLGVSYLQVPAKTYKEKRP